MQAFFIKISYRLVVKVKDIYADTLFDIGISFVKYRQYVSNVYQS